MRVATHIRQHLRMPLSAGVPIAMPARWSPWLCRCLCSCLGRGHCQRWRGHTFQRPAPPLPIRQLPAGVGFEARRRDRSTLLRSRTMLLRTSIAAPAQTNCVRLQLKHVWLACWAARSLPAKHLHNTDTVHTNARRNTRHTCFLYIIICELLPAVSESWCEPTAQQLAHAIPICSFQILIIVVQLP